MVRRTVAVLGAGVAGLASALALARDGHRVVLVERDSMMSGQPDAAWDSERKGIPHFQQPHAFIPRGRQELLERFPDVHQRLCEAGARDVDLRPRLPGPAEPGDDLLQYMAVRRPLLEWGLQSAVLAERGIEVRSPARVTGIRVESGAVTGVRLDEATIDADIVVDALGRNSPVRSWLTALGCALAVPRRSDCGVIYYSRYYRVRPGCQLPDGPWLLSPRGDVGYLAFSSFPGDNGTFAAVLAVPTGVPELKVFAQTAAFDIAIAHIPLIARWANADVAEPITPVLAMGGLQNSIYVPDQHHVQGWVPVADALCHTDPVLAHGLSFCLTHATSFARALREHHAAGDAWSSFQADVMPTLIERYAFATQLDEQRLQRWVGERPPVPRREHESALFSQMVAGAMSMREPGVCRPFLRRFGLLEPLHVFDADTSLQDRIEARFREVLADGPSPQGPSRDEMLRLVGARVS